ncbi:MAG TPA: OB-fold nucleic acid binding domain-containing protein, partial [Chitinophagaceae bacterium]|nr:OB-fold nucleic acid binding domain-containing protein [Chitinophagaceae bacterium]
KITFFMEECKRMGLKVLGPDINESLKGFAVNRSGEIRFGLGGLKGVGEAAVESIIAERKKGGAYSDIFNFIKRINQRTVNKKTLESLAYAGGFDCFTQHHRAQYFCVPEGETANGLERIIKYGQIISSQNANTANTLFGDLPVSMEIPPPRLPDCAPWPLVTQLENEKEVTGMFLSGHPLDHYRFEMKHYGITSIADFNEFRESIKLQLNPGRMFRIIALVTGAQHRVAQKSGNKYGSYIVEDFSGKTEFVLFSEDYLRLSPYLQPGASVCITGYFKQRYNQSEFEFKVQQVVLAETLKKLLTRQVSVQIHPRDIDSDMIGFIEKNIRNFPGNTSLRLIVNDPKKDLKISMLTTGRGIEMNEELIHFLEEKQDVDVAVITNS